MHVVVGGLFFSEAPDSPDHLNIDSFDKHSVDLSWEAPKHDGGNPVKGKTFTNICEMINSILFAIPNWLRYPVQ